MSAVSIEKCLDKVPNKFTLSVLSMNRAKEILLSDKSEVETTRYTKKSVNKSLKEIEENILDIDSFKEKIKEDLTINTNNPFSKENVNAKHTDDDADCNSFESNIDMGEDIDAVDEEIEEDVEDDINLDDVDIDLTDDDN